MDDAPLRSSTHDAKCMVFGLAVALATLSTWSCSRSTGAATTGSAFDLVAINPGDGARIFLNSTLRMRFSRPVDVAPATLNALAFEVRDLEGRLVDEVVRGSLRFARDVDGASDPTLLDFVPALPTNDSFDDGGFRPGRSYSLRFARLPETGATLLRSLDGQSLGATGLAFDASFETVTGATASELFLDRSPPHGPRVIGIDVTPSENGRVGLNDFGSQQVEVVLAFNEPLARTSTNLPLRPVLDAARSYERGRIFLEYDDPELGVERWIRTTLELRAHGIDGSTLVLRPEGILPNAAELRIIVEATLEDISGRSNENRQDYDRVVGRILTQDRLSAQFSAVSFDFEGEDLTDYRAPLRDPLAEFEDGEVRASLDFPGVKNDFDYEPTSAHNLVSTDLTTLVPRYGLPMEVRGGVFDVRSLHVREGVTVQGVGSNPMVWRVRGDVHIDGHLHVNGGAGAHDLYSNVPNQPNAGGRGACSGGDGGSGGITSTQRTTKRSDNGNGPFQELGAGGEGAAHHCTTSGYAPGGGGGSHVQVGDHDFVRVYDPDTVAFGRGGAGSPQVEGGLPMPAIVRDAREDNDFWGRNVDAENQVVRGEVDALQGGGGGGGGGDRFCDEITIDQDGGGGGGGGGAGALVIRALGTITIGPKGLISADGGHGGGGADHGGSRYGGGGGGGAGGMGVFEAARIVIHSHERRWAERDTSFAVTADGGIGTNTSWNSAARLVKYHTEDGRPNRGGFGGMGLIQLMTPHGDDADQSGNVQDDNIVFLDANGAEIANKQAWLVDGDLRPNPILLPATFGPRYAWASRFVATGASVRRIVDSGTGPRSTTSRPPHHDTMDSSYGPEYAFQGTETSGPRKGYVRTDPATGAVLDELRMVGNATRFAVAEVENGPVFYRGLAAYRVRLRDERLPPDGSFSHETAVLYGESTEQAEFKILGHDARDLFLDASAGPLPSTVSFVSVRPDLFEVAVDGRRGLGSVRDVVVNQRIVKAPRVNLQVGFAFHSDATRQQSTQGSDPLRYPSRVDAWAYDLETSTPTSERTTVRRGHYPFTKLHLRFNLDYDPRDPSRSSATPPNEESTLALRFLRLPFVW